MEVAELTGAQLDYWVAKAEGWKIVTDFGGPCWADASEKKEYVAGYSPSTNWAQGGPIIEREVIDLSFSPEYGYVTANIFVHGPGPADVDLAGQAEGYSPLVAAMRAYVESKFGKTVSDEDAQ
jgi:hypothetical protein